VEYENIKIQIINIGKYTFNSFKIIYETFLDNLNNDIYKEVSPKEIEYYEQFLISMNSELLKLIIKANTDIKTIINIRLNYTNDQIYDISLFSNFFKFNIKDIYKGIYKFNIQRNEEN
jgi:hypothetical protein